MMMMARPQVPDSRSRHSDIPTPVHNEVDFQAEYLTLDAVSLMLRTTRNDSSEWESSRSLTRFGACTLC
jgi:hypothetical protein